MRRTLKCSTPGALNQKISLSSQFIRAMARESAGKPWEGVDFKTKGEPKEVQTDADEKSENEDRMVSLFKTVLPKGCLPYLRRILERRILAEGRGRRK